MSTSEVKVENWSELESKVLEGSDHLSDEYKSRLKVELKEIGKQGANDYWVDLYNSGKSFDENSNGLVLPFILGLTKDDPIKSGREHVWERQPDMPDIDVDFLPISRPEIKKYIAETYGHDYICSVGNWITYKLKSAIQDVCRAFGGDVREAMNLTSSLPDDFDDMEFDDLQRIQDDEAGADKYKTFFDYYRENKEIVDMAFRLVGMIRAQGTHAGGVIISNHKLDDLIPMSITKADGANLTSQWTEGKNTQLSKFGLIKFDLLGLKTMYYIWRCCGLIKENRNIEIDWSDMDPDSNRLGWIINGEDKEPIMMDDPKSVDMINRLSTESIFQHETSLQKSIIEDGKVKGFWDLVAYSSLGRPGPMDMIPSYIKRRDGKENWRSSEDETVAKILDETHGVITFQEQLTGIWRELADFTVPQAEESRKIISKKWLDKLPKVKQRWMDGASKKIGEKAAKRWWKMMNSFGRYAFNKSHAVAYSIISFRCLYLKAHFGPEWWAAVMSACHSDKLTKYMGVARQEGVVFAPINVDHLREDFGVNGDQVSLGIVSIKGIGHKVAKKFCVKDTYQSIQQFITRRGKNKTIIERLTKLGAFDNIYDNRKGLYRWYLYKHGANKDSVEDTGMTVNELREEINSYFMPSDKEIEQEKKRQSAEYFSLYPNRKKIPKKIENWKPRIGHRYDTPNIKQVMDLFKDSDYTLSEMLTFEKEYLGYYWSSPMSMYESDGYDIEEAKKEGILEAVIENIELRRASSGMEYMVLHVTDGKQNTRVNVWPDVLAGTDDQILNEGVGLKLNVKWSDKFGSFTINGSSIMPLMKVG